MLHCKKNGHRLLAGRSSTIPSCPIPNGDDRPQGPRRSRLNFRPDCLQSPYAKARCPQGVARIPGVARVHKIARTPDGYKLPAVARTRRAPIFRAGKRAAHIGERGRRPRSLARCESLFRLPRPSRGTPKPAESLRAQKSLPKLLRNGREAQVHHRQRGFAPHRRPDRSKRKMSRPVSGSRHRSIRGDIIQPVPCAPGLPSLADAGTIRPASIVIRSPSPGIRRYPGIACALIPRPGAVRIRIPGRACKVWTPHRAAAAGIHESFRSNPYRSGRTHRASWSTHSRARSAHGIRPLSGPTSRAQRRLDVLGDRRLISSLILVTAG